MAGHSKFANIMHRKGGQDKKRAPRLILAPLLAFDHAGGRLGQGGGHYDRIISLYRAHGCVAIGLAYAEQEMPRVPSGPHDAS